jgi:glycosyltransferase involved in cell wall biosynthesis
VTKQIIVADDNPDRSAAAIVKEFSDVIYLQNPTPSGGWPGRVRNFAFTHSLKHQLLSKYVHFLDDDDTVPEGHYAIVKDVFINNPKVGVVFGILRPFCNFSDDHETRQQQEAQLLQIQNWRMTAARYPWLYQQIGDAFRVPLIAKWLFRLHATFGWEMFLCSGGMIRHESVLELGGFPDVRITQDYWFFTEAIRKYGVLFLRRETAGYGVGDPHAVWNPLDLDAAARMKHTSEWTSEFNLRQRILQKEMGKSVYRISNIMFRIEMKFLNRLLIPILHRRGFFEPVYQLTDPARAASPRPRARDLNDTGRPHRATRRRRS